MPCYRVSFEIIEQVANTLDELGIATAADLRARTGRSQPTISRALHELERLGCAVRVDVRHAPHQRGKPPEQWRLI